VIFNSVKSHNLPFVYSRKIHGMDKKSEYKQSENSSCSISKIDLIFQECEKAFREETRREECLTDKAEKYVVAIASIIGFKIIDLDSLNFSGLTSESLRSWLAVASFVVLGIALAYALKSRQVWNFLSYPRKKSGTIIDALKSNMIDDDTAMIKMAKTYEEIREHNALINDERAILLSHSGVLIVFGFIFAVTGHLVQKFCL